MVPLVPNGGSTQALKLPISAIGGVVERQLCCGFGACAYVEPRRIRIGESEGFGRRPFLVAEPEAETGLTQSACTGARLEHTFDRSDPDLINKLAAVWGFVYQVFEGYANDDEIRFAVSSGGGDRPRPLLP